VEPVVGNWYQHQQKGQRFVVLAVLGEDGLIEIQYFDGSIDQVDREEWRQFNAQPIEPPEDWTGPLDSIERDDLGYDDTAMTPKDWAEGIGEQRTRRLHEREDTEEGDDEWGEGGPTEELRPNRD
jgi:hypothetical protein